MNLTQQDYDNSHDLPKHLNPNEKEYHLKCFVKVKEISYLDEQSKGSSRNTEKMIFLIPQESDERTRFLMAWLPETIDEHTELGFEIGYPVFSIFRGAVKRYHKEAGINLPFIFVMTRGVEEILKQVDGLYINIKSLGESDELRLDAQKDYELSNIKPQNR